MKEDEATDDESDEDDEDENYGDMDSDSDDDDDGDDEDAEPRPDENDSGEDMRDTGCSISSQILVGLTLILVAPISGQFGLADLAGQRDNLLLKHLKSMSTQPRSQTRWDTL